MGPIPRWPCRRKWMALTFVCLAGCSPLLFSQAAPANQPSPAQVPAAPADASGEEKQAPCTPLAENGIPIRSTIEARVTGLLESNHLKPGKKLWVNSVFEMDFPECRMAAGAPVYGTVTAASSSKNPNASELAFAFDGADCVGHAHRPMKLVLVGMIAAPDEGPGDTMPPRRNFRAAAGRSPTLREQRTGTMPI